MDFLPQQNRRVGNEPLGDITEILAGGKHVVVIGGGDTGSDCIGTSLRQGALSVTQLEIMPAPPEHENKGPHLAELAAEDADLVEPGRRRRARIRRADPELRRQGRQGHPAQLRPRRRQVQADPRLGICAAGRLVLLAMGFVHPVHEGMLKTLGVDLDQRGNVRAATTDFATSLPKVFSAGDMRRGQSLVVWAIREGRLCARAIDQALMGTTTLRGKGRELALKSQRASARKCRGSFLIPPRDFAWGGWPAVRPVRVGVPIQLTQLHPKLRLLRRQVFPECTRERIGHAVRALLKDLTRPAKWPATLPTARGFAALEGGIRKLPLHTF